MPPSLIQQGVSVYRQWKTEIIRAAADLQEWLARSPFATSDSAAVVRQFIADSEDDRLTLAVVAEHPGAAVALLNALLFSAHGRPLLPPGAGPPPCLITLHSDASRTAPSLRLLPMETRALGQSLSALQNEAHHWIEQPLAAIEQERYAHILGEVFQTKKIASAEATRLGLGAACLDSNTAGDAELVEVPKWRHALVNLAHPLLDAGLAVVIAPSLAELDGAPEIGLQTLHDVDATLFVVDMQTGPTRADLAIWHHHLRGPHGNHPTGLIVAINDSSGSLTDPPTSAQPSGSGSAIETALDLAPGQAIHVSAELGLAARIRSNRSMLLRSRLPRLELALDAALLEGAHRRFSEALDDGIGSVAQSHYASLSGELIQIQGRIQEIDTLRGRSKKAIEQLGALTREQHRHYVKAVAQFQAAREQLIGKTQRCREILAHERLETLIQEAHRGMARSWTTRGLRAAMQGLLDTLREEMQALADESERLRELVRNTYRQFEKDHGFALTLPKVFVLTRYNVELELIYQEVDLFRRSRAMAFAEQSHVIERFHQQIASRTRVLFEQLRRDIDLWTRNALHPIADAISQHKTTIEKRIDNLRRIGESEEVFQQRIEALREEQTALTAQLEALRNIESRLYRFPPPPQGDGLAGPLQRFAVPGQPLNAGKAGSRHEGQSQ
jgi:hypothetical protein